MHNPYTCVRKIERDNQTVRDEFRNTQSICMFKRKRKKRLKERENKDIKTGKGKRKNR